MILGREKNKGNIYKKFKGYNRVDCSSEVYVVEYSIEWDRNF